MTTAGKRAAGAATFAALAVLIACSPSVRGTGRLPPGIVFVREAVAGDSYGTVELTVTRAYRDGRVVATYPGRVLVARDNPAASLLYDDRARKARALGGGPWRAFSPCPDPYNHLVYELSPNGRRGLCFSEVSHSEDLVVFDVDAPSRTRRVAFEASDMNRPYIAGWVDDDRIATLEYRPGRCPHHRAYGFPPAGLVIIDVRGRVLERGPCMAGVLAGPRGLVYVEWKVDWGQPESWLRFFGRPQERPAFSTDEGRSWHFGYPQFASADGRVYYSTGIIGTLYDDAGRRILGGLHDAAWARSAALPVPAKR